MLFGIDHTGVAEEDSPLAAEEGVIGQRLMAFEGLVCPDANAPLSVVAPVSDPAASHFARSGVILP